MTLAAQITPTGIIAPTYADILAELRLAFQSIYGADVYIAPDSQDGQILAVFAKAIFDANNGIVDAFNSFAPDFAQGIGLSSLVKINGIRRLIPTNSSVDLTITGTVGTVIANGVAQDTLGQQWNLPAIVTIPNAGTITVTAISAKTGSITTAPATITKIASPTYGWQTVNNVAAATPGSPVETDAQLRRRQTVSPSLSAQTVVEALIGAISNVVGVQRMKLYENDTGTTDGNGIPGHSICVVVQGGDTTEIAQTIARKKTPGTGTYGSTSTVVFDTYGLPSTIKFYILNGITLTTGITIQPLVGFVTTTADLIQQVLATFISSLDIGEYSFLNKMWGPANLSGDIAMAVSGLSQAQLDILSKTYNVLAITQSRAANPIDTTVTGGPYGAGLGTVAMLSVVDIYAGQTISIVLDDASLLQTRVTLVAGSNVTFNPVIPAGRSINTGADVYLISDIKIAFNEAAQAASGNVTVTVL